MMKKHFVAVTASALLAAAVSAPKVSAQNRGHINERNGIRHVLLVSIDGMHVVDFTNCANGISGVNGGAPYCPNLAALGETGVNYLETSTSKPSDSAPGLTAIVSGGSPRTEGFFYDVAYDRSLAPPATTTGNGLLAGNCTPGVFPGTSTEYEEGIDKNQLFVNGIDGLSTASGDGGVNSIDPAKLVRDPAKNCNPVFPWNFVRTNTVFGVIHNAGGFAAWSDKHPAYTSVAGPGPVPVPNTLDDFYGPEINSNATGLSAVVGFKGEVITPLGLHCGNPPDSNGVVSPNVGPGAQWTDSFQNIQCYDTLKVQGVLNQIDGFNHSRTKKAPVPTIFGMNFQAVSVGQKLIEHGVGSGGYLDATGTPSAILLHEIQFVDASIGEWVSELKKQGLFDSTLIIITAKHGQSPIDSPRYQGIGVPAGSTVSTAPSAILSTPPLNCIPDSELNQIGTTEDDGSLLWLNTSAPGCDTVSAVNALESASPASANIAGIGEILFGSSLAQMFNPPGFPNGDPRTPDIIVISNIGVTFSGSGKKQAEHGGFNHDDTNVIMLLSHPGFHAKTITSPVETTQVAPTILKALGLDPNELEAVQKEGTQVLPGLNFEGNRE